MTIYRIGEERHYTHRRHNPEWPLYIQDPQEALKYMLENHQPVFKSANNRRYIELTKEDLLEEIKKLKV